MNETVVLRKDICVKRSIYNRRTIFETTVGDPTKKEIGS